MAKPTCIDGKNEMKSKVNFKKASCKISKPLYVNVFLLNFQLTKTNFGEHMLYLLSERFFRDYLSYSATYWNNDNNEGN